jgi:hypothetical protein
MRKTACCLPALLLPVLAFAAPPQITRDAGGITVSNAHYAAVISTANGSLQRLVYTAFGEKTCLPGGMIYSDIGLLKAGSHPYFGTNTATGATVSVATEGDRVTVSAEGLLSLEGGKQPEGAKWRYRFQYTFDATPVVRVIAGVQTDTPRPPAAGFFATTLSVAGVNEWFADTEQGMKWVNLGPENGRCFEMHNTPLRPDRRRLGLINHDSGAVVLFDNIRTDPPGCLEDVIFHSSGTGSVTAFFNWLDGQQQTAFEAGKWYDIRYDVSITEQLPDSGQ